MSVGMLDVWTTDFWSSCCDFEIIFPLSFFTCDGMSCCMLAVHFAWTTSCVSTATYQQFAWVLLRPSLWYILASLLENILLPVGEWPNKDSNSCHEEAFVLHDGSFPWCLFLYSVSAQKFIPCICVWVQDELTWTLQVGVHQVFSSSLCYYSSRRRRGCCAMLVSFSLSLLLSLCMVMVMSPWCIYPLLGWCLLLNSSGWQGVVPSILATHWICPRLLPIAQFTWAASDVDWMQWLTFWTSHQLHMNERHTTHQLQNDDTQMSHGWCTDIRTRFVDNRLCRCFHQHWV